MDRATAKSELRNLLSKYNTDVARLALNAVVGIEYLLELVSMGREDRRRAFCGGRTEEAWARYYVSLGEMGADFPLDQMDLPPGTTEESTREELNDLQRGGFAALQRDRPSAVMQFAAEMLEAEIEEAAAGGPPPIADDELEQAQANPALGFLLGVVLPCLALYRQLPQHLYARAIHQETPDLNALECLVTLDSDVIHLRAVRELRDRLDGEMLDEYYAVIAGGLSKKPSPPPLEKLINDVAFFVSYASEAYENRMSAPDIGRICRIVAKSAIAHDFRTTAGAGIMVPEGGPKDGRSVEAEASHVQRRV